MKCKVEHTTTPPAPLHELIRLASGCNLRPVAPDDPGCVPGSLLKGFGVSAHSLKRKLSLFLAIPAVPTIVPACLRASQHDDCQALPVLGDAAAPKQAYDGAGYKLPISDEAGQSTVAEEASSNGAGGGFQ
jgi:hypothetical protein